MPAHRWTISVVAFFSLSCALAISPLAARADEFAQLVEESKAAYRQGDPERSVDLLRQALQERPGDEEALHLLAVLLLQQGQFEEADKAATSLVERFPGNSDYEETLYLVRTQPRANRFFRCQEAGAYDCALREANGIIEEYRQSPGGYAMFGIVLILRNEPGDRRFAGSVLHQAVAAQEALPSESYHRLDDSIMASVYSGLGISHSEEGDYAGAETYFRKALELGPQLADGRQNLEMAIRKRREAESSRRVQWLSLADIMKAMDNYIDRRP